MDLLSISRTVWRHKLATVPVLLIVLVGMAYVLVGKKPIYQAHSSYILLPPPMPPLNTAPHHPARKGLSLNNPFAEYGNLSVIVDLLTEMMSSPAEVQVLANQGVTGTYTVASLPSAFGNTGAAPIIEVTAQGPSPVTARTSATLVGMAVRSQLDNIQASQGTSYLYWIRSMELTRPDRAQQQVSNKLRNIVAVIAVGVILLFAVVSTMNALEERKRDRQAAQAALEEDGGLGRDQTSAELALGGLGLPYAAKFHRARGVQPVRAGRGPGGQVVELGEELKRSDPSDFDSQLEEGLIPPRDWEDR